MVNNRSPCPGKTYIQAGKADHRHITECKCHEYKPNEVKVQRGDGEEGRGDSCARPGSELGHAWSVTGAEQQGGQPGWNSEGHGGGVGADGGRSGRDLSAKVSLNLKSPFVSLQ